MGIIQRKLEQLQRALKLRRPRWISILVDGDEDDQSSVHAIAHELNPGRYDLVTYCSNTADTIVTCLGSSPSPRCNSVLCLCPTYFLPCG